MRFCNRKKPQSRKEHDMHTGCNGSAKITGIEQLKMHLILGLFLEKKNNHVIWFEEMRCNVLSKILIPIKLSFNGLILIGK